jgi:hypothetical protein
MFPQFNELTDDWLSENSLTMAGLGFVNPESAVEVLWRLSVQWLTVQRESHCGKTMGIQAIVFGTPLASFQQQS